MTELLTTAQMRAIEQAAIDSGEVTGLELMERAGRGVVEAIFEEWPELAKAPHRAVVLCGPGNNGGDGFVVARLLKEWGWEVEVFLYGDPEKLPPDARVNYERWGENEKVSNYDALSLIAAAKMALHAGSEEWVIVDALFGIGQRGPLDDVLAPVCELVNTTFGEGSGPAPIFVNVDVPTGYDADTGESLAKYPCPIDLVVTFHGMKPIHGMPHLEDVRLHVVDIGLKETEERESLPPLRPRTATPGPGAALRESSEPVQLIDKIDVRGLSKNQAHKYAYGHALVLSGGPGRTGAARLAARGALRIGAGLVTIGCPQNAVNEVACQTTAIMVRGLDGPPGLREMLEDQRLNALCLGPGLGLGADTHTLVMAALEDGQRDLGSDLGLRGVVLDADALTRFERNPDTLFEALHERCVLTPHGGEFRRLFPDIAEKLEAPATSGPAYSKVDATREAAARAGCVLLFKGPDTVIADPSGRCSINSSAYERSAPWLATAGSGDVLAGFITGLLARGFEPMEAAETAAWLHTECALSFGPGLIAEDLPEELPKVFARLFSDAGPS